MAGGNVGTINVAISANAEQFQKGLKSASDYLSSFASNFASTVAAFASYDIAKKAAGYIGDFAKESFTAIDRANDLSQELQTNINSLRAFGFAAQMSGSSAEEFNDAARKMQKTIGEAAAGNEDAIRTFTALGLNFEQMKNRSATENFAAIAESISNIATPAEQAAAALAVFGKSGQGMINTLKLGADGLREQSGLFRNLRADLSDAEVNGIAKANDALDQMREYFGGIGDVLAAKVAPYITGFVEKLFEIVGTGDQLKANISSAFEGIVNWAQNAGNAIDLVRIAVAKLNLALAQAAYLYAAEQEARANVDVSGMSKHEAGSFGDFVDFMTTPSDTYQAAANGTLEDMKASAANRAAEALKAMKAAQEQVNEAETKFANADGAGKIKRFTDEIRKLGQSFNQDMFADDETKTGSFKPNAGNRNWFKDMYKESKNALSPDWFQKAFSQFRELNDQVAKDFSDKLIEGLKTPLDKFKEFSDRVLQSMKEGRITADQAEKALNKEALDSFGTVSKTGGARAIDSSLLAIEGLRQNRSEETKTVSDPVVHKLLESLLKETKAKKSEAARIG